MLGEVASVSAWRPGPAARPDRRSRARARSGGDRHRDRAWPCGQLAGGRRLPVYAINPLAASRYRDRHTTSGAKSDATDAKLLADLVRTDHHNHRPVAGDSDEAGAIRVLARAHQGLIWTRQRQLSGLRSALRDYFPGALVAFGADLGSSDALAILAIAPTPAVGRGLSRAKIASALARAGRRRNLESGRPRSRAPYAPSSPRRPIWWLTPSARRARLASACWCR